MDSGRNSSEKCPHVYGKAGVALFLPALFSEGVEPVRPDAVARHMCDCLGGDMEQLSAFPRSLCTALVFTTLANRSKSLLDRV